MASITKRAAIDTVNEQWREFTTRVGTGKILAEQVGVLVAKIVDALERHAPDYERDPGDYVEDAIEAEEQVRALRSQVDELRAELDQADRSCQCESLSLVAIGKRRRRVLLDVSHERDRQHAKWGDQQHDAMAWLAILSEEVGEAARAALHDRFSGPAAGTLRAELVQVAAVAVQVLEHLDRGLVR